MSETFTPGPWWIAGKGTIRCGQKHDAAWIADVHWRNREANAAIIAAAPELYEALEYARDCLLGQCESDHPAVLKSDAALAKARGETR